MMALIQDYTFENFVRLACNQDAFDLSVEFAAKKSIKPSLLFFGLTGLGKTHLQNAIGHEWTGGLVLRTDAKEFEKGLETSAKAGSLDVFRAKYRSARLLLFDSLQVVAGKDDIQRELLKTLMSLKQSDRHSVICSIAHHKSMPGLCPRLKEWIDDNCVVSELQESAESDRLRFATEYVAKNRLEITRLAIEELASLPSANFFELQGRLNRFHFGLTQPALT